MRAVLITNDPVRLSFVHAALKGEGIEAHLLDDLTSSVEGSIGVIPRRLVVAERDEARARAILAALEADLAAPGEGHDGDA